jgi:hypothetical protein
MHVNDDPRLVKAGAVPVTSLSLKAGAKVQAKTRHCENVLKYNERSRKLL